MSYQALYRKFRPGNFSEVYGQDHIVTTLKNQIKSGRVGHAYVFSGTRGTGKTSVAKIFAKTLNCENPGDNGPCGVCDSCKKINEGASFNVIEVDGASNNGVDNIRSIIDDVSYPPAHGFYKIYIIDEAHMVTKAAFNALLKTMEEPPEYAVFILATTEVNTIPITILSRCQRYDFHRITVDMIAKRMDDLRVAENIDIEDKAIRYIARLADGSMRDALSIFDQCISYYFGQHITFDMTLKMLGASDVSMFSGLYDAVAAKDSRLALDIAGEAIIRGMEPESFVSDFTWYLRNILLVKNGANAGEIADVSTEDARAIEDRAAVADEDFLMRAIELLSDLLKRLQFSSVKRVSLEIGIIRLCKPMMDEDYGALLARIKELEKGEALQVVRPVGSTAVKSEVQPEARPESRAEARPVSSSEVKPQSKPEMTTPEIRPVSSPEEKMQSSLPPAGSLADIWPNFVSSAFPPDRPILQMAVIVQDDENSATIYFEENSQGDRYGDKENAAELRESINKFLGRQIDIDIRIARSQDIPVTAAPVKQAEAKAPVGEFDSFMEQMSAAGIPMGVEE